MAGIRGSTVTAADGSKMDIKRIKVVPADSSTAQQRFGTTDRLGEDKRRKGGLVIDALRRLLESRDDNEVSLTRASTPLRESMAREGNDYDAVLARAKAKLVDLVRLAPEVFKLVNRPTTAGKDFYYVQMIEN